MLTHSVCARASLRPQSANFKLASYPPQTYAGVHLTRRTITAGLGGIDPTM